MKRFLTDTFELVAVCFLFVAFRVGAAVLGWGRKPKKDC